MLDKVKLALRISISDFDEELKDLIQEGLADLGLAGVLVPNQDDPLIRRAVITYCRLHWGDLADKDFARLKAVYDEQKVMLMVADDYTNWGEIG